MKYKKWMDLLSLYLLDSELTSMLNEAKANDKFIGLKPQFDAQEIDFFTINMLTLVDKI